MKYLSFLVVTLFVWVASADLYVYLDVAPAETMKFKTYDLWKTKKVNITDVSPFECSARERDTSGAKIQSYALNCNYGDLSLEYTFYCSKSWMGTPNSAQFGVKNKKYSIVFACSDKKQIN